MIIHLLGPSGSGTSTLGKVIAERLNIPWYDTDDLFWMKTDPPFTTIREKEKRILLLQEILENNKSWVLSGSIHNGAIF
jgi:adenylate kinase family enzyme